MKGTWLCAFKPLQIALVKLAVNTNTNVNTELTVPAKAGNCPSALPYMQGNTMPDAQIIKNEGSTIFNKDIGADTMKYCPIITPDNISDNAPSIRYSWLIFSRRLTVLPRKKANPINNDIFP